MKRYKTNINNQICSNISYEMVEALRNNLLSDLLNCKCTNHNQTLNNFLSLDEFKIKISIEKRAEDLIKKYHIGQKIK